MQPAIQRFEMGAFTGIRQVRVVPSQQIFHLVDGGHCQVKGIAYIPAWHREIPNIKLSRFFHIVVHVEKGEIPNKREALRRTSRFAPSQLFKNDLRNEDIKTW